MSAVKKDFAGCTGGGNMDVPQPALLRICQTVLHTGYIGVIDVGTGREMLHGGSAVDDGIDRIIIKCRKIPFIRYRTVAHYEPDSEKAGVLFVKIIEEAVLQSICTGFSLIPPQHAIDNHIVLLNQLAEHVDT